MSIRALRKAVAAILVGLVAAGPAHALPRGGQVSAGQATISQSAPHTLQINQATERAIINWRGFSIDAREVVRFAQPGASSIALNRVTGGDPSIILGQLSANGRVFLVNQNGIVFGPGARVDVAGLVATTLAIKDGNFLSGRHVFQQGTAGLASIVNAGTITAAPGGFVALSAPSVVNQGTIVARLGSVHLSSGRQLTVDFGGDGLVRFAVDGALASAAQGSDGRPLSTRVSNEGRIEADGGEVVLTARVAGDVLSGVVNHSGAIEARSLVSRGGVARLTGEDDGGGGAGVVTTTGRIDVSAGEAGARPGRVEVTGGRVLQAGVVDARGGPGADGGDVVIVSRERTLAPAGSVIDVSGGPTSSAGSVRLWSDGDTILAVGALILARGGALAGDGGFVEISGREGVGFAGGVDTRAPAGRLGTLLFDPRNITIVASGVNYNEGVNNLFGNAQGTSVSITASSLDAVGASVTLQANSDVTVNAPVALLTSGASLTIRAGRDVNVNANLSTANGAISITANDNGAALADRAGGTGDISIGSGVSIGPGTGDITLAIGTLSKAGGISAGVLSTTSGNISITSRNAVTLSSAISTTSGTIAIAANADGAGAQAFRMNAGSSIAAGSAVPVAITVNSEGGTAAAVLGDISAGSGGSISINTAGGAIIQTPGTLLDAGTGTITLAGRTVGTSAAPIATAVGSLTANAGTGGVFVTNQGGASFTATASGRGQINLTTTSGTLTIAGPTSTGTGAVTLTSGDAVVLDANLGGAGSGVIRINANADGEGSSGFVQNASITTTNATANAIQISVNEATGGTGGASLRDITTGPRAASRISVLTDKGGNTTGGSITQAAGTLLNAGAGTVLLTTPANASGIGTAGTPIRVTANTVTASAGAGGVFITETNGASFTATAALDGPIALATLAGTLTIGGATFTGSGPITLTSPDAIALNQNVGGAGTGPITISANTTPAGNQGFTQNAGGSITTGNTSPAAVAITVNANTGGTGAAALRDVVTGPGAGITIVTSPLPSTTGGSITQAAGTLLDAAGGTITLRTGSTGGIGTLAARVTTNTARVDAVAGTGGVFVTNQGGASFTAVATGAGQINLTTTNAGTLTIAGPTSTGRGVVTLTSDDGIVLNANLGGAGSGVIRINTNIDPAVSADFVQNAAGSITTTNATINAVQVHVNEAAGGSGGAALRNITTGSGGRISVLTDKGGNTTGGAITQAAGTLLDAGTGSVILTTPANGSGVGASGAPVHVTANTVTARGGAGGAFVTETNGASFTATATLAGPIELSTTTGTLTISGATFTGSGPIILTSEDAITLSQNVGGAGTGPITIAANTDGIGAEGFTQAAGGSVTTGNTTSDALLITVNAAGGGTGAAALRGVSTGSGGGVTVLTNPGGNTTGGSITQSAGTLIDVGTGSITLGTGGAGAIGSAVAKPIFTQAGTVTAAAGSGGVFVRERDGAGMAARATAAGPISLVNTAGTLQIVGPTATDTGTVAISSGGAVVLDANVGGAGTGIITINANTGGAGAEGFAQTAASSITTANTSATAVQITVNASGGGAGGAALGAISTGNGGRITVLTNPGANVTGGSISQVAGTLDVASGSVILRTPTGGGSGVGGVGHSVSTRASSVTATTGSAGVFVTEADGASMAATATGGGPVALTSLAGPLTISGATGTGSGPVTLTADTLTLAALVSTTGAVTLQPATPDRTIGVAGGAGALDIGAGTLANLAPGFSSLTIGRADGTGAVNVNAVAFGVPLTIRGGALTVNGALTAQGVTLSSSDDVVLNAPLDAGAGLVSIRANTDGAGSQGLTMSPGSSIATSSASAAAVDIGVNAGGGTGGAVLGSITTGPGDGVTVATDVGGALAGGSIAQVNGAIVDAGTLTLRTGTAGAGGIGAAGTPIVTTATTIGASAGSGGATGQIFTLIGTGLSIPPGVLSDTEP